MKAAHLKLVPDTRNRPAPVRKGVVQHVLPTEAELLAIPIAAHGEYELTEKETQLLRSRIYSINKGGFHRFRTMRYAPLTFVWKVK